MATPVATASKKKAQFKSPLPTSGAPGAVTGSPLAPGPAKGIPAPATPPPPPPPVYGAAPPTAQGQAIRSDSQTAMQGAQTDWRDSVYRAVMGLGDPTQIAKYQQNPDFAGYQFATDPNSTYSQLDRGQQDAYKGIDNGAVQGNTFFSGLRLNSRDDARQSFDFQRAGATNTFTDALANYARTLAAARAAAAQANTQADQVDFDAANAIPPTPSAVANTQLPPPRTAAQINKALKAQRKKGK